MLLVIKFYIIFVINFREYLFLGIHSPRKIRQGCHLAVHYLYGFFVISNWLGLKSNRLGPKNVLVIRRVCNIES